MDDASRRFNAIIDATRCRRPGWIWLGCIVFGVAVWTGAGFGIRALIAAL